MMDLLLQNNKIAAATHNILAYRIMNSIIHQDSNAGHNYSHSHSSNDNGCRYSGSGNSGNCNTPISPAPTSSPPPFHSSAQAAICIQDYDDDGETHAGARLLHLLQVLNVTNVAVVVSRWFGGTLLGPSRFAIINDTARRLLNESGPWGPDHRRVGR
uniref:Impact N-terminal domain-containing protein n=1 Tax=Polytomella parva TaxID=51329 RepID=A0A7S0V3I6_9CHLO|mmetsp:Transcript_2510/g.3805  ORF Transcript_2510/g.3805 Transcript_2510/m.3805 type:complete len:157 (+) Transcript_2510:582-1052(+)